LFYIVLLYVLVCLGVCVCVYVSTVVRAGYPALMFQLIVLYTCV